MFGSFQFNSTDPTTSLTYGGPKRSLATIERIATARLQTSLKAFDVLTPPYPDYAQLVSALEVPSLLIIGGSAGVVSASLAAELQALNPGLQVEQIAEVGHGMHYDQPEQFATLVKSFLASIAKAKKKR